MQSPFVQGYLVPGTQPQRPVHFQNYFLGPNMASRNQQLYEQSQRVIPGGVNSPVRAFRSVGGNPIFVTRGEGAVIWDADGNSYIDYVCSWGPLILGHAHPDVVR